MPVTDGEILKRFGEVLVTDLRARIPHATGKTAEGITSEVRQTGDLTTLYVYAPAYIMALEDGRGPTKPGAKKGSPTLYESILEWVRVKNIKFDTLKDTSVAYLISRKIHLEGNKLYRAGGKSGVISGLNISGRVDRLLSELSTKYQTVVGSQILKDFK